MHGKLHDVVHARKPSALDGALVKGSEPSLLPEGAVPQQGDDVVYMFPKLFERQVEVLVFVASAPAVPGKVHDLSSSSKLDFLVSYIGEWGGRMHVDAAQSCWASRGGGAGSCT